MAAKSGMPRQSNKANEELRQPDEKRDSTSLNRKSREHVN